MSHPGSSKSRWQRRPSSDRTKPRLRSWPCARMTARGRGQCLTSVIAVVTTLVLYSLVLRTRWADSLLGHGICSHSAGNAAAAASMMQVRRVLCAQAMISRLQEDVICGGGKAVVIDFWRLP